jgi:alcohol dehydrogenase class IV
MTQERLFGGVACERLRRVLDRLGAARVFLVTGGRSFAASGAQLSFERVWSGRRVFRYSGFSENPKIEDVTRGIAAFRAEPFDAVVAVGGGSVMDMAKLINALARDARTSEAVVAAGLPIEGRNLPLVAIPTTSGSGSEATPFAVLYVGHVKHSIAGPGMLPEVAIVDPGLTLSMSPTLTAVTGMDAFSQAVESYWGIHSTERSKAWACRAIALVLEHLERAVNAPSRISRRAMSKAAHFAGCAIAVTKTTGAHALSYPLTSYFGIPHGHAVSLTLGQFLVFNSRVTDGDVTDPRGAEYVRRTIDDLVRMMGCQNASEGRMRIETLMQAIGLKTRLRGFGVSPDAAVETIVRNVNVERMVNNPRALSHDNLRQLVEAVC